MREPARIALVLTTVATDDDASKLAHAVVGRRLAACVNIVARVRSVYRWKGAVQDEEERLLIMKTAAERVPALCDAVRELHPYEVPEIVVLEASGADPAYAGWVAESVEPAEA